MPSSEMGERQSHTLTGIGTQLLPGQVPIQAALPLWMWYIYRGSLHYQIDISSEPVSSASPLFLEVAYPRNRLGGVARLAFA